MLHVAPVSFGRLGAAALVVMLAAACSASPSVTPVATPAPAATAAPAGQSAGYPVGSAYPGPGEVLVTEEPTPTPDPALGQVAGILQLLVAGAPAPVPGQQLYLADLLKDANGVELVASYSQTTSPRAFTDAAGRFVFHNVKPGRYTLFLDTVVQSYILLKPGTQDNIFIEVAAAQTADVGTLTYDALPVSVGTPAPTAAPTAYP